MLTAELLTHNVRTLSVLSTILDEWYQELQGENLDDSLVRGLYHIEQSRTRVRGAIKHLETLRDEMKASKP